MFLIRWLHKWFGLILGLQFLLWTLSGAMMALLDHHKVAAEDAVLPPPGIAAARRTCCPGRCRQRAAGAGAQAEAEAALRPLCLRGDDARRASGWSTRRTGQPMADRRRQGRRRWRWRAYSGIAPVRAVDPGRQDHAGDPRVSPLPLWRVEFADKDHTTLFVSADTGEVLGAKNDTWRLWDVAWMLHIMDYAERKSFNHPLIITVAHGAWPGWRSAA